MTELVQSFVSPTQAQNHAEIYVRPEQDREKPVLHIEVDEQQRQARETAQNMLLFVKKEGLKGTFESLAAHGFREVNDEHKARVMEGVLFDAKNPQLAPNRAEAA